MGQEHKFSTVRGESYETLMLGRETWSAVRENYSSKMQVPGPCPRSAESESLERHLRNCIMNTNIKRLLYT